MALNLRMAGEEDSGLWDELVKESSQGTIFHTWKFLKIMEEHTRKKLMGKRIEGISYPILAFKGSNPVGLIPLFFYKHHFVRFVLSPPLGVECLYLGHVLKDYDTMKQSKKESTLIQFQNELNEFITLNYRPQITSLNLSPGILDSRPFKWTGYDVEPRHTYIIDLKKGTDHIWAQFHKELRRCINKTLDKKILIQDGSKKELKIIYNLLTERRIEQGMDATTSLDYLLDIYKEYGDNLDILVAKHDSDYISGLVTLYYKNKAAFWIGAPKITSDINANELLLWESIKLAYEKGYTYYEIMGANHPSLYKFKTKFNGDLVTSLSCKRYSPSSIKILEILSRAIKSR